MRVFVGSKEECDELREIANKTYGPYPRPPTRVVGLRNRAVSQVWDGKGDPPFGWTVSHVEPRKHPAREEWAVIVPGVDAGEEVKLTAQERAVLSEVRAASVEKIPDDWDVAKAARENDRLSDATPVGFEERG
jgi:hypothetical protein